MLNFLRNSISLITDPRPRMSFFVFLGAFILSYFVYKFLRRFEKRFFEYHLDEGDDVYENIAGSATTTLDEPNALCVNPNPFDNTLDSTAVNYPPYINSFIVADSVKNLSSVHSGY